VYLHAYGTVTAVHRGQAHYFTFCHEGRPHTALDGQIPDMLYFAPLPQREAAEREPGRASRRTPRFLSNSLGPPLSRELRMGRNEEDAR
jgi:hypothetical protein